MRRDLAVLVLYTLGLTLSVSPAAIPVADAAAGPNIQGDPAAVAELTAVYRRFAEAKTWRSRMNIPGPPPTTHTVAFVAPDRFHTVLSQGGNVVSEFFMIGSTMWAKSGGTCTKLPTRVQMPNPRDAMQQQSDAVIQVTKGGTEAVDGGSAQTYNVTISTQGTTVRQKIYVANGLPRRMQMQSDQGTIVIDYFDYGAAITINDPPC